MTEGPGNVLIVDDDSSIRRAVCATLGGLGFAVEEACNGEGALALVRGKQFDAVLLDVNMPGMGGMATCKELRRLAPILPILILTVRDSQEDIVRALDAGADDYITKPFHIRELAARLKAKEFDLLHYMMANAGMPIAHARLLKAVWGPEYGSELEYLRTFIRQLRLKIEDDPSRPSYVLTDAYVGYRFCEPISEEAQPTDLTH